MIDNNTGEEPPTHLNKFKIDNNIKVEFVDGLKSKGKAVEGNTTQTTFLGKNKNPTKAAQTRIDKKKLEIQKLKDKITMLEGGNAEVSDPLDILKEKTRIASNELKDLTDIPQPEKIGNITIQIDSNAEYPYATLRAELEHARDLAKGAVPREEGKHFARYAGANEAEVAPSYNSKTNLQNSRTVLSDGFQIVAQFVEIFFQPLLIERFFAGNIF